MCLWRSSLNCTYMWEIIWRSCWLATDTYTHIWWNTLPANSALSSVLQRLTESLQKHAQHVTFDHSCSHISLWKRTDVIKLHPLLVVAMVYENSNYSVSISKLHWPKTGKALDTKLCQLCQIKTYSYCYYFSYWLMLQFLVVLTGKFP